MTKKKKKPRLSASSIARSWDRAAAAADIRKQISGHLIAPGAKIRESDLVRQYKLTRLHAREVLHALEVRGLVDVIPNNGAVVRKLELDQVFELYDVREVLEGLCVRLATQRGSTSQWQVYLKDYKAIEDKARAGDIEAFESLFLRLRQDMLKTANNPFLSEMLDTVFDYTAITMRRVMVLPGRVVDAIEQQSEMLVAMIDGNADLAEELRRRNIRSAVATLQKYQRFVV